jgi:Uma2 family endonuclease
MHEVASKIPMLPVDLHRPRPVPPPEPAYTRDGTLPLLYEDDDEGDMGESFPHATTIVIVTTGIQAHLAGQPTLVVFMDMNLYYSDEDLKANISPDGMVVAPARLPADTYTSYRIGPDGPAPLAAFEVLSERSAQQRDLGEKAKVYASLRVPEYILIDVTGRFLPQKLLLKRLQPDGTYRDERDPDGGVTSRLGFRVVIEPDGWPRILKTATGRRNLRPTEAETAARAAEAAAQALQQEKTRNQELEAELARLRQQLEERPDSGKA